MFLQVCVILFTVGGCLPLHAGITPPLPQEQTPPGGRPPPGSSPPPEQTPLGAAPRDQTPPKVDPPGSRHPPPAADTPLEQTPLGLSTPPRNQVPPSPCREVDSSIRSTSGRYASYWNAFLFCVKILAHKLYWAAGTFVFLFQSSFYRFVKRISLPYCFVISKCQKNVVIFVPE